MAGAAVAMGARQMLWDQCRIVVEPAATAFAALTSGAHIPSRTTEWPW